MDGMAQGKVEASVWHRARLHDRIQGKASIQVHLRSIRIPQIGCSFGCV
ncbi:MAG: hypothetical protein JW384_01193 [Nitrosomonadaceae bacterium]|nr:hypothetical protein [Nitrosomonadaceae bacterium]